MKTTQIWADTVRQGECRSRNCHRTIYFAQNVKTGNDMPFDVKPEPLYRQLELETSREKWTVDLAHNHFASCPDSSAFRRKKAATRGRR